MLQRLYVHNFRCLENFEFSLKEMSSALLIGRNGVGKSTIASALELFQSIGRGVNRVGQLIQPKDFATGRSNVPIRFEIEVLLEGTLYKYVLALELPGGFRELRVLEEHLLVSEEPVYLRKEAQVALTSRNREAQFLVDWHLIALPVIQEQSETDPLRIFRTWLARMIILAPIPSVITGDSNGETLEPKRDGSNFGEWFSGLLSRYPAAYKEIDKYLQAVMPDISDIQNELVGKDFKSMIVRFEKNNANLTIEFKDLSDGEKCFFFAQLSWPPTNIMAQFFVSGTSLIITFPYQRLDILLFHYGVLLGIVVSFWQPHTMRRRSGNFRGKTLFYLIEKVI